MSAAVWLEWIVSRRRTLLWSLVVIALGCTTYLVVRHKRDLVDFEVYRTAAARAWDAEPLYRPEDGHYQFKYLPAFAIPMTPFAVVDMTLAKAAWCVLSVGLLVIFVRRSIAALPNPRVAARRLAWITVLLMAKFYAHEIELGQTNILLGVVLVSSLAAAQRRLPILAGALVGVAVFVKPYALVLVPWLVVSQGVPAVLSFGGVLAAGLVMPVALYGWAGNRDLLVAWLRTVTDTTAPNLLLPENISMATMWAKWIGVGRAASVLAMVTACAAMALTVAAMEKRRRVAAPDYLEFGMLMLLVPLISPQGWDYVLLIATPAVIVVVDRFHEVSVAWRVASAAALALMSFTIFDLVGRTAYSHLMAISIVTVAALGLIVCLAHLRWRSLA